MTRKASPVRHRRLLLVVTSALGGFAGTTALAQTVPAIPAAADAVRVRTNLLGLDPQITNPNGDLNVKLRASNTVIDWNGFNIPENRTANFENGTLLGGNIAVLNRDVSNNVSQLLGKLTSDPSVAVWVYNPNGIVVGAKAAFNTGSLVLSTLDVETSDFLDGGRNYRLGTTAGSTSGITVLNGAQIKVEGGTRGLVMVAPRIDAEGTFQAVGQDVAFVTATDVTLTYNPNSPLSVTLNRGTAVPGRSQYVRGSVAGADALFALASQGTVTDALLQVDASVTTALAGTRGIVLSAGRPANAVDGVAFAGVPADTAGVVALTVNGALTTTDRDGSDILAGANGAASFAGALTSERDILLAAAGPLSVANAVTAGRDYRAAGRGIALGGAVPVTQRAAREVRIETTDGDIVGAAGLTLRSGGSAALVLSADGTIGGDILFDGTSRLIGGNDRQGYVDLRLRTAGSRIALGDVTARGLRQGIGAGAVRNGVTTTGVLTLGAVDVRDALALEGANVTTGTLASDRGVAIVANGALATGAILARDGSVALTGSGATAITGDIAARVGASDIVVRRDGAIDLQGLAAARDVRIDAGAGAVAIAGGVAAGRNYLVTGGAVTLGGTTPVTQAADADVTITAGAGGITGLQGLTLRADRDGSGGDALTLAVTAPSSTGIAFATGTRVLGGGDRQSDVQIRLNDAASPITLDRVEARNLTGLNTTGALRLGDATIVGDLTARGGSIDAATLTTASGAVTLVASAGAVTTGAVNAARAVSITGSDRIAAGRLVAGEGVTVDGQGDVAMAGDVLAGDGIALRGASLNFAGGAVRSGGSIDLLARSGGIASTGALALGSTSTRNADFVRLQANGATGIVFAPGSTIAAGTDRALRVAVFNGTANAPLALGDVTARSLSALAAAGGDATRPGGAIVTAGNLRFGALDLVDSFAAESSGGDLSVGRIAVTGAGQGISLRAANGALSVQNDITASGDVTLASGTALRLNSIESRDGRAALTSGGALTLAALTGARGASATGTQVTIDAVRGGTVALTASAGNVQVGRIDGAAVTASAVGGAVTVRDTLLAGGAVNLTATGDVRVGGALTGTAVTVRADGDAALLGGAQANGNMGITGRSVTLGGVQSATGRYAVASTAGDIVGRVGTAIIADSDAQGAEALVLNARGGGIAFDPASTLRGGNGTSAVALTTDGGGIAIGDVRATALTASGAATIRTGNLSLVDALTLRASGGISTGAIGTQTGAVTLAAGTGPLATGAITAGGSVALSGGTVAFGRVQGSSLTATAAGTLTGGDIVVGDAVALQAGDALGVGAITAGGSAGLSARSLRFGRLEAAALTATSGGALIGGDIVSRGDAALTATGAIGTGVVRTAGTATLRGTSIAAGGVGAAGLNATATAGDLTIGDAAIGDAATLNATGVLTTGAITAGGAVALTGAGIGFARIDAGSFAATASSDAVRGGTITTRGIAAIDAATAVDVGAIRAGGATTLRGGSIRTGGVDALSFTGNATGGALTVGDVAVTQGATLAATGGIATGAITAGGAVTLTGREIGFARIDAGSAVATASGGAVRGGDIVTRGIATLTAADIVEVGTIRAAGMATLRGTNVRAGRIDASALTGAATGGGLIVGDVTVTDSATLEATDGIATGAIAAGGAVALTGREVGFVRADAGSFAATASGGVVRGGDILTRGGATVVARDAIGIAAIKAGGGVSLRGASIGAARIEAAALTAAAGNGAFSAGDVVIGDGLSIEATRGTIDVGTVTTARGDVAMTAAGRLMAAGIVAGGAATLRTTTVGADILQANGLTATNSVTLNGAGNIRTPSIVSRTGDLTIAAPNGELTGFAPGTGVALGAGPGRAFSLTIGGAARLGDVAGGKLTVVATAISAGRIDTGTQGLDMRATNGDLTLTGPVTGGIVNLGASGRTSLTQVTASGALTLTGGTGIGFGDIAGASIDGTSGGAIAGGSARSGGALGLRGTSLTLDQASAAAGMTLTATAGDLRLTGLTAGGDAALGASGLARITGGVTAGGAYRVSGGSVTLGGDGIVQRAAGEVRITATAGDVTGARGLTLTSDADNVGGDRLVLDAAGGIGFAGTRLLGGSSGGAPVGLRAGSGRAIQLGSVQASRIGGFDGSTVLGTLSHDAGFVADDLAIGTIGLVATRGDVAIGRIVATGDVGVRTDNGAITLGEVRGGGIDLSSSGALTTGAVTGTGAVSLRGERIDVAGRLAAARQLLAEARAALTLRDASAGGAMTLTAGGALTAGALDGGAITATGAGVTLAGARAGDGLTLTSRRDLSICASSAGGTATLDVAGLATIAGLTAGPAAAITANDVALDGPLRAQTVAFTNRAAATGTMRIGDGTGTDGFRLSDAEVRRVTADTLRFDAGSGAMEVGTLALATGSGRAVDILGTGDIRVVGAVSTEGTGRSVRIGGARDSGNANAIHVIATSTGGGRLSFDGSDVELRGSRIAIGLAAGFIDTLQPGAAGLAQAQTLIGNGNSALYNPQLGGGFYDPNATTTLSARTLTVRFGDYALFQNTAIPGSFSGLQIGGTPTAPITPALRISSFGNPAQASVALFGTINGIGGASAALLGNPVINIDPLLLPNSRINGCLAGSGAGCITTIVIQPTLQVFDWNSEEVFGIARDVTVPFAPVIGGNNEELLTDLPALAPQSPADRKGEP